MKKGELTTQQIVLLIILITSFIVILFFFFRLNLQEQTQKEICHNSVVLKSNSKIASGFLDCRTNYLCISSGSSCESINPTQTIKISSSGNEKRNEVFEALAKEMSDCWWQFGEGKLDYAGGSTESSVNYALCSIVEFDFGENLQFSYKDFYDYLQSEQKSESQTYLQYLYSINSLDEIPSIEQVDFSFEDGFDSSQTYSILTGIDKNLFDFVDDDIIFGVYIIPTLETNSRLESDRKFVTKS
ncbi:MAG: hypothetical protein WDZ77_01015 [Candidatus Pacearchaeota archaeon]